MQPAAVRRTCLPGPHYKLCVVLQLHSEYRSTYRWHEYTPKQSSAAAVVRTPPQPSAGEPPPAPPRTAGWPGVESGEARRKKQPELASNGGADLKLRGSMETSGERASRVGSNNNRLH